MTHLGSANIRQSHKLKQNKTMERLLNTTFAATATSDNLKSKEKECQCSVKPVYYSLNHSFNLVLM